MGERIWTPQQRSAIDAAGGTLLVSAAAGSGKTAVLVQRVIERLTSDDPDRYCDADRLLIVTFTRAAAAEMKERITAELQKKAEQDPWDARMRRQMILIRKAPICTIDSFCSRLVRDNFYKLEIAPDFRIADESELKILKDECINDVLERNYAEGDEDFFELVEQLIGDKNDSELSELLKSLDFYIGSFPFPEDRMTALQNAYSAENPAETVWGRSVLQYVERAAAYPAQPENPHAPQFAPGKAPVSFSAVSSTGTAMITDAAERPSPASSPIPATISTGISILVISLPCLC